MNKAMIKLMLSLLVALVLGCRSVPREEVAGQADSAPVRPEMPPGASKGDAESPPPQAADEAATEAADEAAAEAGPSSVTLPRPEREPPAAVAGAGTAAGLKPPLPETEPGDPLTRLNSLPPGLDKEFAWPPLESYWRPDLPSGKEAEEASPNGQDRAAVTAAAADKAAAAAAPQAAATSARQAAPAAPQAAAQAARQAAPAAPLAEASDVPAGRQILARPDDRVEVQFDGTGWLFLGFGPQVADEDVRFLSRESNDGRTSFTFRAHELGSYDLGFQLQDVREGSTREETVTLQVLPEEEFDRRLASTREDEEGSVEPAPDYERAEKLYARGELDLALVEFISNYREGDAYANDRIAAIYLAGREYEAALKYYRRNLDSGAAASYRDRAVLGAVRAGLGLRDPDLVLEFLENLLGLRSLPIAGELVEAARLQLSAGRHAGARLLLREYRTRYPRGERMDEVLFLLGRLYEQDSPLRDLEISRAYYQRVYDEYPESLLADEAYERLRYLDRHFFHVQ